MRMDIQRKLWLALGSVKDHASIGKAMIINNHEHKGFSDIEIAVVRATGHDNGSIDDKHMHEILFLVSNSPGSIPFLAECISRRLAKTRDRLVAIKTLLLIHRLLRGGNRLFEQQLRSAHASGHLQISSCWFLSHVDQDPSVCFLHKYAAYLEERISWIINQAGKLEPAVHAMSQGRSYDDKSVDLVFRKLPKCQVFIDRVIDCLSFDHVLASDNSNIIVQAATGNTLRESFQVYIKYCECVAALVNMFFDLTTAARALACQILKRASQQSQELHDLYKNWKQIIGSKNFDYPVVEIITMDHVMALEQCSGYVASTTSSSPILDCLTKPTKLPKINNIEVEKDGSGGLSLPSSTSTLFSRTLETKISKVWVLFEDDNDDNNNNNNNNNNVP